MPAITAATSTLPRLPAERPEERDRPVRSITNVPPATCTGPLPSEVADAACRVPPVSTVPFGLPAMNWPN